jgi:hypothetical protein
MKPLLLITLKLLTSSQSCFLIISLYFIITTIMLPDVLLLI